MINVPLDEGIAAALSAKAAAQGLTVQAYLEAVALSHYSGHARRISPDDIDRFLDEEAMLAPSPAGTFSRTELYSDHD